MVFGLSLFTLAFYWDKSGVSFGICILEAYDMNGVSAPFAVLGLLWTQPV